MLRPRVDSAHRSGSRLRIPSRAKDQESVVRTASATATAQDVVSQLDAIITAAVSDGRVASDAADQLRNRVNDLSGSIGKGKARKIAQNLLDEIKQFQDDARIDQPTADQLTALLQPFIRNA